MSILISLLQPTYLLCLFLLKNNIAINTAVTVVLGTETFDQGSDFASNTFTAPVTGKYQLSVALRIEAVDTAPAYYQIKIGKRDQKGYAVNEAV